MNPAREQARGALEEALPKSAHKHIRKVLDALGYADAVNAVEIVGARVAVETVSAYGLVIELDANGNAVTIGFPYGAEVTE